MCRLNCNTETGSSWAFLSPSASQHTKYHTNNQTHNIQLIKIQHEGRRSAEVCGLIGFSCCKYRALSRNLPHVCRVPALHVMT